MYITYCVSHDVLGYGNKGVRSDGIRAVRVMGGAEGLSLIRVINKGQSQYLR